MKFGLEIRNNVSLFSAALLMIITVSDATKMFVPLRNVCRLTNFQFNEIELTKAERKANKTSSTKNDAPHCANDVD